MSILFRCPKNKHHQMSLEQCQSRKAAKQHGCVTCSYPKQVKNDLATIEGIVAGRTLDPRTAPDKRQPYYIRGLTPQPLRMTRRVAADLLAKLQAVLANTAKV